jgi:histidinol-phosphate aminotransferase
MCSNDGETDDNVTFQPERIARPHIKPMASYVPGVSPVDDPSAVRLDWNESPYGLSPKAQAVYDEYRNGNRYPTFAQDALIAALAKYAGAPAERIIAGAGLDDVFATLAITIIEPGDEVIISDPTFGVYRSLFEVHGAHVIDVPLGPAPDFALDTEGIITAANSRTKLIIVCNPNNPTGTLYSANDISRIVESVDAVVAIDEAYAEFSGVNHLGIANLFPNVVLLRTLSKFAGLAGYRVGYGIFPESLMPWIRRAAPAFYNVSAISAAIAVASLDDLDHLEGNVAALVSERSRLIQTLNDMPGVEAFDSAANFVLLSLPVRDSAVITSRLETDNVFVRSYSGSLAHCIRVSVGTPEDNTAFLVSLRRALQDTGTP